MPDVGFGGNVGSAFSGAAWVRSDGIGMPTGRSMADGGTGALLTAGGLYLAGNGGARNIQVQVHTAVTPVFAIGAAGHPVPFMGYAGFSGPVAVNGGAASVYGHLGGSCNFGRSSTSGGVNTYSATGGTWSGTIGGAYRYVQGPTAPGIVSVTPSADGTQAAVLLSGVADNGGTAVTAYRIQRATNAGFTTGVATIDSDGSDVFTGLTPGTTYYYRAVARNAVTNAFAKLGGQWSATVSALQPDPGLFGRVRNPANTTWVESDARVRNPANNAWVELEARVRNPANTTWVEIGS